MPNAQTFITRALNLIGAVGAGQTPSDNDIIDGFATLNDMFDAWAGDGLTIPANARTEFNMTVGDGSYTLGPGGDFNTPRPGELKRMSYMIGDLEYPLTRIFEREYRAITNKSQTGIPSVVYVDNTAASTLYAIRIWPAPNQPMKFVAYLPVVLVQFASLTTQYTFLPGYNRAIRYNLAVDLAPEHELPLDGVVAGRAAEFLADIRRNNIRPEVIEPDGPASVIARGGYNIYSDRG